MKSRFGKNEKKIIGVSIIILMITSTISINAINNDETISIITEEKVEESLPYLYDELDQYQNISTDWLNFSFYSLYGQSFKPTKNILTRVKLLLKKISKNDGYVWIQIRSNLSEENITEYFVLIENNQERWIEFDFTDFFVYPERTYYITVRTNIDELSWPYSIHDDYKRGGYCKYITNIKEWIEYYEYDFCFETYGYNDINVYPDLYCDGDLSWSKVQPNSIVNGEFRIKNAGTPKSILDWEIIEYPEWGEWNFTPSYGYDLKQEDGDLFVQVSVNVPDNKYRNFGGEIKIINIGDPSDNSTISVSLSTQKSRQYINPLFLGFIKQYPNLFNTINYLKRLFPISQA